jgi:hypothetical protein
MKEEDDNVFFPSRKKKNNIEKKCREGRELTSFLLLLHLG